MRHPIAGSAQLATQVARLGWFYALGRVMERRTKDLGHVAKPYKPTRPVPSQREMFTELANLLAEDAANVASGLYPAMPEAADSAAQFLARIRAMFADLPDALARRSTSDATSASTTLAAADPDIPEYFRQDFHFQKDGYLSDDSARLYDVQVETLFMGSAAPMRRACLIPVANAIRGRDQRTLSMLDVACGTGRFLRQARLAFPALKLTGLDLSSPYLTEAETGMKGLRPAIWLKANAEKIPLPDASQDIVTSIFLFHELPPEARHNVIREFARVLKPSGTLVFMDSLQMGDKPGWDGLLEAFPHRFHEPYFRHYAIDDLEGHFTAAGLAPVETRFAFMSKLMVRRKS